MNSKTRTIVIILSSILAGLLIVAGGFVFLTKRAITKAYKLEDSVQIALDSQRQDANLKTLLTEIGPKLDAIKGRIVNQNGTVDFIEYISGLARSLQVPISIDTVTEGESALGTNYQNLVISVSVQGSWQKVYSFLHIIESLPYKSSVQSSRFTYETYSQIGNGAQPSSPVLTKDWKGQFTISVLKNK